jgi:hypothetical protein
MAAFLPTFRLEEFRGQMGIALDFRYKFSYEVQPFINIGQCQVYSTPISASEYDAGHESFGRIGFREFAHIVSECVHPDNQMNCSSFTMRRRSRP